VSKMIVSPHCNSVCLLIFLYFCLFNST